MEYEEPEKLTSHQLVLDWSWGTYITISSMQGHDLGANGVIFLHDTSEGAREHRRSVLYVPDPYHHSNT